MRKLKLVIASTYILFAGCGPDSRNTPPGNPPPNKPPLDESESKSIPTPDNTPNKPTIPTTPTPNTSNKSTTLTTPNKPTTPTKPNKPAKPSGPIPPKKEPIQQTLEFEEALAKLKKAKENLKTTVTSESPYYIFPTAIYNSIDFTEDDFKNLEIKSSTGLSNRTIYTFIGMAMDILGELFSTPKLMNDLVSKAVETKEVEETIIEYIKKNVQQQAEKYKRDLGLITFYFAGEQGSAREQIDYIKEDLRKLLYNVKNAHYIVNLKTAFNSDNKRLWIQELKNYIESAIDAGKKHSPSKPFIKWENVV